MLTALRTSHHIYNVFCCFCSISATKLSTVTIYWVLHLLALSVIAGIIIHIFTIILQYMI